ncbi:DUF502 domain-containing protein [Phnomibacter ginsenosidimutans]|uniref:DUF502 domain-containing protein n=1 Tax=Phnomibacter ginsenosidimutans TaxID=2676868 RepID=A0A6I6GLR9_9BACT|nr:DUF502 domain-containing protein [Phnomibacter ginsenosidimutans]QGW29435.1 DUF502 domain-containing protein [Phnomibacter ginsenosidimutans]
MPVVLSVRQLPNIVHLRRSNKPFPSSLCATILPSRRLFQYFLQGILVLAPVSITAYIIYNLFSWLDRLVPVYINLSGDPQAPFYLPGIGFIMVMVGILIVGYLSSFFVIGRLLSFFDHALEKTPGVKTIYSFVKDFSEAFAGKKESSARPFW